MKNFSYNYVIYYIFLISTLCGSTVKNTWSAKAVMPTLLDVTGITDTIQGVRPQKQRRVYVRIHPKKD